jgi:hypothetical protein
MQFPLLAPNGPTRSVSFLGVDRKWAADCQNDALDPERTTDDHHILGTTNSQAIERICE